MLGAPPRMPCGAASAVTMPLRIIVYPLVSVAAMLFSFITFLMAYFPSTFLRLASAMFAPMELCSSPLSLVSTVAQHSMSPVFTGAAL